MKVTKEHIECLQKAKAALHDSWSPAIRLENTYICYAINQTNMFESVKGDLCMLINDRIKAATVVCWLANQGHMLEVERDSLYQRPYKVPGLFKKVQAYRKAWIDELIKELQSALPTS